MEVIQEVIPFNCGSTVLGSMYEALVWAETAQVKSARATTELRSILIDVAEAESDE
jgi:hypothetical protein